jgi:hypothetical protein
MSRSGWRKSTETPQSAALHSGNGFAFGLDVKDLI